MVTCFLAGAPEGKQQGSEASNPNAQFLRASSPPGPGATSLLNVDPSSLPAEDDIRRPDGPPASIQDR